MSATSHPKNPTGLINRPVTCRNHGNHKVFSLHHIDLWFSRIEDKCRFDILSSSPQDSINGHGYSLIWYTDDMLLGVFNPNNHSSPCALTIQHNRSANSTGRGAASFNSTVMVSPP